MKELESLLRQVLAIETLEYEDKNHLSGNDESRCRVKMELITIALRKIEEMKQVM